ncbi:MAG TPA: hypothetical protein PLD49_08255, partial [Thermoclostridium caenicola]|nr:hypothetical protein [Thermoclostridium caenicola]
AYMGVVTTRGLKYCKLYDVAVSAYMGVVTLFCETLFLQGLQASKVRIPLIFAKNLCPFTPEKC